MTNQAIVYVLKQIKSYDIIGLQETKCDVENVDFSSYYIISIPRPKENDFPTSGGIIILINPSIRKGIQMS